MLSRKTLETLIDSDELFVLASQKAKDNAKRNVQSSSVDLTIRYIFSATKGVKLSVADDLTKFAYESYDLKPGETVVVQVSEMFQLSNSIGGIVFPPNSLSKKGIVMTNPGHIDPGFKGCISVCLVNMGRETVKLTSDMKITTLILFNLDMQTDGIKDEGQGVSKSQLLCMGKDFAGLDERIPSIVRKSVFGYLLAAITVFTVVISLIALSIALMAPELTKYRVEDKNLKAVTEQFKGPLEKRLKELEKQQENNLTELQRLRSELVTVQNVVDNSKLVESTVPAVQQDKR